MNLYVILFEALAGLLLPVSPLHHLIFSPDIAFFFFLLSSFAVLFLTIK